jgi:hypothetical protein
VACLFLPLSCRQVCSNCHDRKSAASASEAQAAHLNLWRRQWVVGSSGYFGHNVVVLASLAWCERVRLACWERRGCQLEPQKVTSPSLKTR